MLDDPEEARFIPGIYNYCDAWCARCRFTDRCRVFRDSRDMERRRGESRERTWKEPESAAEALAMLLKLADELAEDAGATRRLQSAERDADPLCQRAQTWGLLVDRLIDRFSREMPGLAAEWSRRVDANPTQELPLLAAARDALETLCWFRHFVEVKVKRATGRHHREEEQNSDAVGTAKLLHESLGRCADAAWSLAAFHRDWLNVAILLANECEGLRQNIDDRFPKHRFFHREGLDDAQDDARL